MGGKRRGILWFIVIIEYCTFRLVYALGFVGCIISILILLLCQNEKGFVTEAQEEYLRLYYKKLEEQI